MNNYQQYQQYQYQQSRPSTTGVWKRSDVHNNSIFKEYDPNYPVDRIRNLSNVLANKYEFFFTKEKVELRDEDEIISARVGGSEEYGLCDSTRRTVYPVKAQNRQNQELYIINQKDYMQGLLVEECSK